MYNIYTDGSAKRNGDPLSNGTYAFLIERDGNILYENGKHILTGCTNNRMELTAIIEAIKFCNKHNISATVHSDSELCLKCISGEYKRKKNLDLWDEFNKLNISKIKFNWIKGHADNFYNNRIDEYCTKLYKSS